MGARNRFAIAALVSVVPALGVGAVGAQELTAERLALVPISVQYGSGTVRLDGMGGFITAVEDINRKISLFSFSQNPAGFGDDKDSWVLEGRYSHREYAAQDPVLNGEDVKTGEAALLGGRYAPRSYGAGFEVNYVTAETRATYAPAQGQGTIFPSSNDFKISSFALHGNWYLARSFTVGFETIVSGEDEAVNGSRLYEIDHKGSTFRGGLGAAFVPIEGVAIGAKGQVIEATIDGTSSSGFHEDQLTWDRPGSLVGGHVFVDRGRLRFGVDYTEESFEGREDVNLSWSPRFILNPDDEFLVDSLFTFHENSETKRIKGRAIVNITDALDLSVFGIRQEDDSWAISNPNAYASRITSTLSAEGTLVAAGGSLKLLDHRLLVAGELAASKTELTNAVELGTYDRSLEQSRIRLGGEYFINEGFVGRLGISQTIDDYVYTFDDALAPDPDDSVVEDGPNGKFNTTTLSGGVGFTPGGGIWQFDVAVDAVVSTDLDHRNTNVSGYLRYLF